MLLWSSQKKWSQFLSSAAIILHFQLKFRSVSEKPSASSKGATGALYEGAKPFSQRPVVWNQWFHNSASFHYSKCVPGNISVCEILFISFSLAAFQQCTLEDLIFAPGCPCVFLHADSEQHRDLPVRSIN